jgi:hypothetical protein
VRMTRRTIVALLAVVAATGLWLDAAGSKPLNPFKAPPLFALGSGQSAGGAHCAAAPR